MEVIIMSTNENSYKSGHPVLAIVLGIIGIVAALLLCLLAGIIGGAIAGAFGLAALLIGISSRKYGKGMGGIVTGVIAILLAVALTSASVNVYRDLQKKAEATGIAPLMSKYLNKPELGIVGLILNIPKDEASLDDLSKELDALNKLESSNTPDATAAPAPAETAAPTEAPAK